MRPLDNPDVVSDVDRSEMLRHVLSLGLELQDAWTGYAPLPAETRPAGLVVAGIGGSGAAGDYLSILADARGAIPVRLLRGASLPNWVTPGWLVVCCSYSGDTTETLEVYREAGRLGLPRVAITAGGTLGRLAREDGTPTVSIAYSSAPRAAFPHYLGAVLRVAASVGVLPVSDADIARAVVAHTQVVSEAGPVVAGEANVAKQVGEHAASSIAVVLAGEHLAPAGRRMRNQLAENGKLWASFEEVPEVAHNAIEGFGAGPGLVVILEGAAQRAATRQSADAVARVASQHGHKVIRWTAPGDGALAEMVAATTWGDLVSCYAAISRSIDPTPIGLISQYKEAIQPAAADAS